MGEMLLRLIQSDLFDARLSLQYLYRHNRTGIKHMICEKMMLLPDEVIEGYMPQLIHLAMFSVDEHYALEDLIVRKSSLSPHVGLAALLAIRSYFADLRANTSSNRYKRCLALGLKIDAVLFEGVAPPAGPTRLVGLSPSLVSMASIAAAIASPSILLATSRMVLPHQRSLQLIDGNASNRDSQTSTEDSSINGTGMSRPSNPVELSAPTLEDLSKGRAFKSSKKSSYFSNEIRFLMAILKISDRMVTVPPLARQSSLSAELALLNHNLPACICLPLCCRSPIEHHLIVRIPPNESVTLNSAERVPFLVFFEIIEDSADFDAAFARSSSIPQVNPVQDVLSHSTGSDAAAPLQGQFPTRLAPDNDEYADRIRTAAVMLAQLYHQQLQSNASPTSSVVTKAAASVNVLSAAGGTGGPDSPTLSAPSSPRDVKRQLKLKSNYEEIRSRLVKEMAALEEQRIKALEERPESSSATGGELGVLPNGNTVDKEDPSASIFREPWESKVRRIRESSPYGDIPSWRLFSCIVKTGADLRQEKLALQLIREMQQIWEHESIPVWVKHYDVLAVSFGDHGGLIETVNNAISIHSIRKNGLKRMKDGVGYTLYDFFVEEFGGQNSERYAKAQDCFMRSLAGYSVATYLLQVKDRHNGNILIDNEGHTIHIDFGFMLSNSPGSMGFESAPFKLPVDFVQVLGGLGSAKFHEFRALFRDAFIALRKNYEILVSFVEMMELGSTLPCFAISPGEAANPPAASPAIVGEIGTNAMLPVSVRLRDRFKIGLPNDQFIVYLDHLINSSINSIYTSLYDSFQYYANAVH